MNIQLDSLYLPTTAGIEVIEYVAGSAAETEAYKAYNHIQSQNDKIPSGILKDLLTFDRVN